MCGFKCDLVVEQSKKQLTRTKDYTEFNSNDNRRIIYLVNSYVGRIKRNETLSIQWKGKRKTFKSKDILFKIEVQLKSSTLFKIQPSSAALSLQNGG